MLQIIIVLTTVQSFIWRSFVLRWNVSFVCNSLVVSHQVSWCWWRSTLAAFPCNWAPALKKPLRHSAPSPSLSRSAETRRSEEKRTNKISVMYKCLHGDGPLKVLVCIDASVVWEPSRKRKKEGGLLCVFTSTAALEEDQTVSGLTQPHHSGTFEINQEVSVIYCAERGLWVAMQKFIWALLAISHYWLRHMCLYSCVSVCLSMRACMCACVMHKPAAGASVRPFSLPSFLGSSACRAQTRQAFLLHSSRYTLAPLSISERRCIDVGEKMGQRKAAPVQKKKKTL